MEKLIILTFIIIGISSCSTSKTISDNENGVENRQKTSNPNTPYIYKNGFENFEIKPILTINKKDSTYINELRFNAVFSALYTNKLMYDKYGKWDNEVWPDGATLPVLVWNKRKLIESQNELYSVITNGTESEQEMYASVIVFDSKNRDCLTKISNVKDSLINYFSDEIRNLGSSKKFYAVYWKMVRKHRRNK